MDDFSAQIRELYSQLPIQQARESAQNIIIQYDQQHPNDSAILDAVADIAASYNDKEFAIQLYTQSIQINPTENPEKYSALAQLYEGNQSFQLYQQGLQILNNLVEQTQDSDLVLNYKSQSATILAAIAELHMTDLCDEQNAEQICEESLQQAIAIDQNCIDAYQQLCNLRLIRGRDEEARVIIQQLFTILRQTDNYNLPTVSFLGETARMCVELNEFQLCEEVCELGLSMDDSQDELLYMLAFSKFRLMKYDKANQLLTHLSHRTEMDPSILEAAMELKEELRKQGY